MDRNEIFRYINVGSSKAICVDRRLLEEYPGIIRNVIIRTDAELQVDFLDKYNLEIDEGEFTLYFFYENFDELFKAVERYIGLEMQDWENYTRTCSYPVSELNNLESSWMKLKADFVNKKLYLPNGFKENMIPSFYWKGLANGKLKLNHTDEELHEYMISTLDEDDTDL